MHDSMFDARDAQGGEQEREDCSRHERCHEAINFLPKDETLAASLHKPIYGTWHLQAFRFAHSPSTTRTRAAETNLGEGRNCRTHHDARRDGVQARYGFQARLLRGEISLCPGLPCRTRNLGIVKIITR